MPLFDRPPLEAAWDIKATQSQGRDVLFRDLWRVSQSNAPFFRSDTMCGTIPQLQARGIRLEPLPHAVYCVPFQSAKEGDGAAQYLAHLFGDAKLLSPPAKGKEAFTQTPLLSTKLPSLLG